MISVVTDEMAAIAEQARQMKRAEYFSAGLPPSGSLEDACMFAALAAVAPLIAAQERERCAVVAEAKAAAFSDPAYAGGPIGAFGELFACKQIAAAIRALGDAT